MKIPIVLSICLILTTLSCNRNQEPATVNLAFVTTTPIPLPAATSTPDFTIHQQALKPSFATDIANTVAAGITHYQINARIMPESLILPALPKIEATMEIRYTNTEPVLLNQVYFRLFPNTPAYGGTMHILETRLNDQPVTTQMLADNSAMFVPFLTSLKPGETNTLSIAYEATVPTNTGPGNGLYAYDNETLSLAGFYPTIPVFDHNGWHLHIAPYFADSTHTDVALYDVSLTAPANFVLVASGTTIQTTSNADNTVTTRMVTGPVRDFYMAFNPTYQAISQDVAGTTVTSYYPSAYQPAGEFALDFTASALAIYDDLLTPYPYSEFDVVAVPVPSTLGGVEYPGVIAIGQRYYEQINDPEDRVFMEFVTAHEVAHQWWYGLVGSDQFTYPWLDEALTQYSTVHYFEKRYGSGQQSEIVNRMFTPFYWQLRDAKTDRAVYGPADNFSETLYYPVVYGKGPLFFEAVRGQLGDEAYFASLRQYADQHRYGLATPKDLLDVFTDVGQQSIDGLYQQWILDN